MSMYLPNSELSPTGFEPVEFIDVPVEVLKMTQEGITQRPARAGDQSKPNAGGTITTTAAAQSAKTGR
jgi:hypothetical protein